MTGLLRDPGQMTRRIVLRTVTRSSDGAGGFTETPVDSAPTWAYIRPLEGDERIQAMQAGMTRPHEFVLRYRAGLTGATRIVYDSRVFDVRSVVDTDEEHVELVILADEVI